MLDYTPFHVDVIFVNIILDSDSRILITYDESPGKRRQNRQIFQSQIEFIGLTRKKTNKKHPRPDHFDTELISIKKAE